MVFTILLITANTTPLNLDGLRWKTRDVWYKAIGSGLNLLYRMDIESKFNFIDQQANDNIVHQ